MEGEREIGRAGVERESRDEVQKKEVGVKIEMRANGVRERRGKWG